MMQFGLENPPEGWSIRWNTETESLSSEITRTGEKCKFQFVEFKLDLRGVLNEQTVKLFCFVYIVLHSLRAYRFIENHKFPSLRCYPLLNFFPSSLKLSGISDGSKSVIAFIFSLVSSAVK